MNILGKLCYIHRSVFAINVTISNFSIVLKCHLRYKCENRKRPIDRLFWTRCDLSSIRTIPRPTASREGLILHIRETCISKQCVLPFINSHITYIDLTLNHMKHGTCEIIRQTASREGLILHIRETCISKQCVLPIINSFTLYTVFF